MIRKGLFNASILAVASIFLLVWALPVNAIHTKGDINWLYVHNYGCDGTKCSTIRIKLLIPYTNSHWKDYHATKPPKKDDHDDTHTSTKVNEYDTILEYYQNQV